MPADPREPLDQLVAALLVGGPDLLGVVEGLVHRDDRGDLDRLEAAVVQVRLQLGERGDDLGVAHEEPHAPACHRERLGQRVQLDRDLLGTGNLEDRGRPVAVEAKVGVGEVVHHHKLVLLRELDEPLHERKVDARGRWIVRERAHEDPGLGPGSIPGVDHAVEEDVPRRPARRCPWIAHWDRHHLCAREEWAEEVDRIARAWYERGVATIKEHPHDVAQAFLRANRMDDLGVRIEVHVEQALVASCDRRAQLWNPP